MKGLIFYLGDSFPSWPVAMMISVNDFFFVENNTRSSSNYDYVITIYLM